MDYSKAISERGGEDFYTVFRPQYIVGHIKLVDPGSSCGGIVLKISEGVPGSMCQRGLNHVLSQTGRFLCRRDLFYRQDAERS